MRDGNHRPAEPPDTEEEPSSDATVPDHPPAAPEDRGSAATPDHPPAAPDDGPPTATDHRSAAPNDNPAATTDAPAAPDAKPAEPAETTAPGYRDLPWKATAQRRDLWGPIEKPLEGTVHAPASTSSVGRPRRRSPLFSVGVPLLVGGLVGVGALALGLGAALAAPLIVAGGALGIGVLAAGGSGLVVRATRPRQSRLLPAETEISEATREVLETILRSTTRTATRTGQLRRTASEPAAGLALEHADSLLRRIEALVGSEQIRSQRPSSGELTMLEGMATRYLPELVDASEETIGFLATFEGSARQEALDNLESIDGQLTVLGEGLERIERDIVGGVSRSLEMHAEFLRTRFADQHLNPLIDV